MKRRRIAVILAALLVAGFLYYFLFYLPGASGSELKASGHIEVTEVDMSLALNSRPPAISKSRKWT